MPLQIKHPRAMTLVEVLVALAIVAFVFSSLIQMTFDALKRAKILELQDKMRNYATEAVQVIYTAKDTDWETNFGDNGSAVLPPALTKSYAYVKYDTTGGTTVTSLKSIPSTSMCEFDPVTQTLSKQCEITASDEDVTSFNRKMFGRLIVRTDDSTKTPTNSINDASIEIIVACIEGRCNAKDFLPFRLSFQIYRTSAPQ